ncbi:hypothetical protein PMAYCL1PPCAC_14290, partial [Pristionchus mayeri]
DFIDELKEELSLNDEMGNNIGDDNSMADSSLENRGEKEDAVNIAGISKESSENEELKKKRKSSRFVSRPVKFADYIEESDGDGDFEPSAKKGRSESMEKTGNYRIGDWMGITSQIHAFYHS